jgi:uncharacterized protein
MKAEIPKIRSWYRGKLNQRANTPLELVMIQSTPFCNLDCKYCYLPNRHVTDKLDPELIVLLMRKLKAAALIEKSLTILWHGNEPLVLKPSYYEDAFKLIDDELADSYQIEHHMQTNATLVSDDYCEFIQRHNIKIGVSIDGPKILHDKNRVDRNGRGSFDKTIQGIRKLQEHSIPFTTICVLTSDSLDRPDDIFHFFRDLGVSHLGFNVDEAEGNYSKSSLDVKNSEQKFIEFFKTLYRLNAEHDFPLEIREFHGMSNGLLGSLAKASTNSAENNPLSIISMDYKGEIASFSPELLDNKDKNGERFTFGNIKSLEFDKTYENERFLQINREIQQGVHMCKKSCSHFALCGGGAPCNKLYENGSFATTETLYCKFRVKLMSRLLLEILSEKFNYPNPN